MNRLVLIYPKLCLSPFLIMSLNITEGNVSSGGLTQRDKRINPAKGTAQMAAAKKKVTTNAINPLKSISYLMMMNQVPTKQTVDQTRIE